MTVGGVRQVKRFGWQWNGRGRQYRALLGVAIIVAVLVSLIGVGTMTVSAATVNVSSSGTDSPACGPAGAPCKTISQAITNAAQGDTVSVAAGTYTEQVLINKNLTLTGAGVGQTIIQAPATALTGNGLVGGPYHMQVLFDVAGGTVTASNFTINGPVTVSSCGDDFYGVFVRNNATLNLSNAAVTNIHAADLANFGGCQTGLAIRYGSARYGQVGNGSVDHVTVTGYGKNGITVTHNSQVTITNNTVTGAGVVDYIAQNGIEIGDNAVVTVTGNTVSGNECGPLGGQSQVQCGPNGDSDYQASGIIIFDVTNGLTIANNHINNNDAGILLGDDAGTLTPLTVSGNTLTGNRYEGIYLLGGPTTLQNNTITGPGNFGIQLGANTDPAYPLTTGTVTYQNNTISSYTKLGKATPTVSAINPNSSNGPAGAVTITGTNFLPGTTVTIGGQACTNVNVPTSISLTCTAPAFTTNGARDVVVTSPDGQSATLAGGYTVNLPPTITGLTPNAVPVGGGQVTITGTEFQSGAQVKVNGELVNSTYVSDTKIVFTAVAHAVGTVTVTVVNPNNQASNGVTLTYGTVNPQPQPQPNGGGIGVAAGTPKAQPTVHAGTVTPEATKPNAQPNRH